MLLLCGILMASRFPTISIKHLRVPARFMVPVLLFVMLVIGLLVSQFWLTLGVIGVCYLISVPICGIVYLRMKKHYNAQTSAVPLPPAPPMPRHSGDLVA